MRGHTLRIDNALRTHATARPIRRARTLLSREIDRFLDHSKRSRCNAFDLIEMRVVCRVIKTNIKTHQIVMIDVDVGDERTTSSLSRATNTLLNHSEAKVVQWRQANYANNVHSTNDNDNVNAR
jgi:hypothetical protein